MTGLCCRHQVRHDDDLCCRHGVVCHGDIAGPAEHGMGEVSTVVLGAVGFGLVLAVAMRIGYGGSHTSRFLVACALAVVGIAVCVYAVRTPPPTSRDTRPPPPTGGSVRIIEGPNTRRATPHEPKEQ